MSALFDRSVACYLIRCTSWSVPSALITLLAFLTSDLLFFRFAVTFLLQHLPMPETFQRLSCNATGNGYHHLIFHGCPSFLTRFVIISVPAFVYGQKRYLQVAKIDNSDFWGRASVRFISQCSCLRIIIYYVLTLRFMNIENTSQSSRMTLGFQRDTLSRHRSLCISLFQFFGVVDKRMYSTVENGVSQKEIVPLY